MHISPEAAQYRSISSQRIRTPTASPAGVIGTRTAIVEVIVSDSRLVSSGSQFGHAAIVVNGIAYSRATGGYDSTKTYHQYLAVQQSFRDSIGYVLQVSPEEERRIEAALKQRVEVINRDPELHEYSLLADSCSSNLVDVLQLVGIIAHDPRGFGVVSPTDVAVGLSHSNRVREKRFYPKLGS